MIGSDEAPGRRGTLRDAGRIVGGLEHSEAVGLPYRARLGPIVRERGCPLLALFPVPGLVSGDEQDGLPLGSKAKGRGKGRHPVHRLG